MRASARPSLRPDVDVIGRAVHAAADKNGAVHAAERTSLHHQATRKRDGAHDFLTAAQADPRPQYRPARRSGGAAWRGWRNTSDRRRRCAGPYDAAGDAGRRRPEFAAYRIARTYRARRFPLPRKDLSLRP